MDLVELSRRLENLIRLGTVHSVDHAARRCRVQSGGLVTQWLPWIERRAGETTTWNPPTVGEQAVVVSPSGEPAGGIVFYGVPSDLVDTPSHDPVKHVVKYPDGTMLSYDHEAGLHQSSYPDGAVISYYHPSSALSVTGIKTAEVTASESTTVTCPRNTIDGDVRITGKLIVEDLLTYLNGLNGSGGGQGNGNVITGDFTHADGNLSSNGIVLHTHTHPGDSGGTTGGPL